MALSGNALLEFASGGITAINSGAEIELNGANSLIAISGKAGNSALTGLASNAGSFTLVNGANVSTTGGFSNSATVEIDSFDSGGSSFTVGGALTNSDFLDIGNAGIAAAVQLIAKGSLDNTPGGAIDLTGSGTANATLALAVPSFDAGSMTIDNGGVLSLSLATFTVNGELTLDGGTVAGGTLSGVGTMETGFDQTGTLNNLAIGAGSTFTALGGSTLTIEGVTVTGSITGSSGAALDFGQAGPDTMTNISGFATIGLATGSKANTLSLTDTNFNGVFGPITVNDGNSGNTVNATGVATPGHDITINAGTGLDKLTGGAGTNQFYAGGDTTMTGGSGLNEFIFTATGSNTIANFGALATNELVFSDCRVQPRHWQRHPDANDDDDGRGVATVHREQHRQVCQHEPAPRLRYRQRRAVLQHGRERQLGAPDHHLDQSSHDRRQPAVLRHLSRRPRRPPPDGRSIPVHRAPLVAL